MTRVVLHGLELAEGWDPDAWGACGDVALGVDAVVGAASLNDVGVDAAGVNSTTLDEIAVHGHSATQS